MGEHIQQVARSARTIRKHPSKQTSETMARRLLDIIVYAKHCQIGATVSLDDLAETEIGDWTMPAFRAASAFAASQGWLTVEDDTLTLTVAGLRAA